MRFEAGLTPPPTAEIAEIGLKSSVYCVVARDTSTASKEAIGMARVVGDITMSLLIVDVCVLPTHQHKGIGHRIFQHLLAWVDANSPSAFLSLSADPPGMKLYERNGFKVTPNETGMQRLGQDIENRRRFAREQRAKGREGEGE
ncbi:ribosomal-protein-alanine acetyltransferase [Ceraceosorus bombacis]|uniref:Ribosomal-protein-alanine acetyltransferase n=1 Tax=Ceraceosorus bombacis TaxID=401625 RepID=A0A0P1BLY2_9BASI|nr:ribosomal-protein-alanine acetyltransferase [Ceraceosorus bombacis]